ncbi:phosphatidylethanolamine-binding protein, partial [Parasitella parasitica]
ITYDEHNDLENGEHLKPEETLVAPSIWFDPPKKEAEYTLAMVNLDSNGPMIRHWIATNVKGGDEKGTAFLSQLPNRQYTSYKGPTPPSGSVNHRVAFILFQQEALNQTFVPEIDGSTTRDRAFFNLTQFAQENKLKPVSAAYF